MSLRGRYNSCLFASFFQHKKIIYQTLGQTVSVNILVKGHKPDCCYCCSLLLLLLLSCIVT